MASQAGVGPREKQGAFSQIAGSVTLGRSDNVVKPFCPKHGNVKCAAGAKNRILPKAIRKKVQICHKSKRPFLMESPKALPWKVWQGCQTFQGRDGGKENVRRSER